ncbi:MAG: discoidin domain-containing protein [Anaerolineales bacterium]
MHPRPPNVRLIALLLIPATAVACVPTPGDAPTAPPPTVASPNAGSQTNPTAGPPISRTPGVRAGGTLDLGHRPLVWFAPLPPLPVVPGRPYTGSQDFLDLFPANAPWQDAASHVQVFKLYGEWVGVASDDELRRAVRGIQARGMGLAVEAGPLDAPPECGQGVEGFAGIDDGRRIIERITAAGGQLDLIAMDEPYYYAHIYDGPNACGWDPEHVARAVGEFIAAMRALRPEIIIGDTEPLSGPADAQAYLDWLETFRRVNGYNLAFLHMDIDWGRPTWVSEMRTLEDAGRAAGVPVGIIYMGNSQDADDEAWISIAGERVQRYELEAGGQPEHVLFQSWNDKPDRSLPESDPYTFTGFIRTYFSDRSALGFPTAGPGANVAYQKPARVSGLTEGRDGSYAVDGDPGTTWSSGGDPLQWIQIDLGAAYDIAEVRLTVSQFPAGRTVHILYGRGLGTGDEQVRLHTFDGVTQDSDVLVFTPAQPVPGIRYIWIDTTESPSWVAWREIEVIAAGE